MHVNIMINFSELFSLEECLREANIEANLKLLFNIVETNDESGISLHASSGDLDTLVEKRMLTSINESFVVSCQQDSR